MEYIVKIVSRLRLFFELYSKELIPLTITIEGRVRKEGDFPLPQNNNSNVFGIFVMVGSESGDDDVGYCSWDDEIDDDGEKGESSEEVEVQSYPESKQRSC